MKKSRLYGIVFCALMAAIVFVTTYFIKIDIPTPAGMTMIKVGNGMCLLAGLLFGGVYGGLAAGIGSMLFDLLDPRYAASAPFTLVFFFIMGAICGFISHAGGAKGQKTGRNIVAALCGAVTYWFLNIGKSIIVLIVAGSAPGPAIAANTAKMVTSGINVVIGVAIAVLLAIPVGSALRKAGIMDKIK